MTQTRKRTGIAPSLWRRAGARARRVFVFMRDIVEYLGNHDWGIYAAGLGFYALISLTPFVVLAVALGGVFFGTDLAKAEIAASVAAQAGPEVARFVLGFAAGAADSLTLSVASVVGLLLLLWSSTNLFTQLRRALHQMWDVRPLKRAAGGVGKSIVKWLRQRLFALLGTLIFGGLFIALLGTRVALSAVASGTTSLFDMPMWVWDAADLLVAIASMTLLVRVVYRLLPDRAPRGIAPWVGSLTTALLIVLGRTGVALYLSVGTVGSVYGAAGTIVVFLGWAYFCAWVFLFGAHLTYALARRWQRWPEMQETPMEGVS